MEIAIIEFGSQDAINLLSIGIKCIRAVGCKTIISSNLTSGDSTQSKRRMPSVVLIIAPLAPEAPDTPEPVAPEAPD